MMERAQNKVQARKATLSALLKLVAVLSRKTKASIKLGAPFVILPNLMEPGLARQAAQRATFVNVAFGVAIEFQ